MSGVISDLRPHWPLVAFAFSAAMLAVAHGFERLGGYAPCPLCLDQREYHWQILALAAVCFVGLRLRPGLARLAAALLGFAFVAAAGMGFYHVAVEQHWVVAQCDAELDLSRIEVLGAQGPIEAPRCDEIAWSLLGVSMAGWNGLASLAMALASFIVAAAPARTAPHG